MDRLSNWSIDWLEPPFSAHFSSSSPCFQPSSRFTAGDVNENKEFRDVILPHSLTRLVYIHLFFVLCHLFTSVVVILLASHLFTYVQVELHVALLLVYMWGTALPCHYSTACFRPCQADRQTGTDLGSVCSGTGFPLLSSLLPPPSLR